MSETQEDASIGGAIYILTSPDVNYISICYSSNLREQLEKLNAGVPRPYSPYASYKVKKTLCDKDLHEAILKLKPSWKPQDSDTRQGFYSTTPEDAYELLECIAKISGTQRRLQLITPTNEEKKEEIQAQKARRGNFSFSSVDIAVGEKLTYTEKDENGKMATLEVTVANDKNKISYQNDNGETETTSLSGFVKARRKTKSGEQWLSADGPAYFFHNGKKLSELPRNE